MNNHNKDSIYDVNAYSDQELYDILELDNPTDRVLEAKILSMVNKYTRMSGNMSADMLAQFFIDIYSRFFDVAEDEYPDEYDTIEGFGTFFGNGASLTTNISVPTGANVPYNIAPGTTYNIVNGNAVIANALTPNTPDANIIKGNAFDINANITQKSTFSNFTGNNQMRDVTGNLITKYTAPQITQTYDVKQVNRSGILDVSTANRSGSSTQLTSQLDYTKDTINPILKQTIKRVISIDSQYRDNKNTATTEFTFNLSEPLKDVVSLKLYSVQIPFTWYTINSSFGGNFFYIKGDAEGINNGSHDYQIIIPSGNYSAKQLVEALQKDILRLPSKYNYDVSFGTTDISYGESTVKTTLNIDIKETFGETNYYFDFPTKLLQIDNAINPNISLSKYIGFYSNIYDCCSLVSYRKHTSLSIDISNINIDTSNNQIQVKTYNPTYELGILTNTYTDVQNNLVSTTTITIPVGTYSVQSLMRTINGNIQTSTTSLSSSVIVPSFHLSHSFVKMVNITDATQEDYGNSYIQMNMKLKRNVLLNIDHIKTVVVFPNDTTVWVGPNSFMGFKQTVNRLGEIESETHPPRTRYIIKNEVSGNSQIKLECIKPGYIDPTNNYTITIPSSQSNGFPIGYRLQNYIVAINQSIVDANTAYSIQNGNTYSSLLDASGNTTIYRTPDNHLKLQVFVQKQFTENDYYIQFSGQWITQMFYLRDSQGSPYQVSGNVQYDLSFNKQFELIPSSGTVYYYYDSNDVIRFISKNPTARESFEIHLTDQSSGFATVLIDEYIQLINKPITLIRDNHGNNPFYTPSGHMTHAYASNSNTTNGGFFEIHMFKKLTTSDYKLTLYSNQSITENGVTSINTWKTYLGFDISGSSANSETIVYGNLTTSTTTKIIPNTEFVTTNDLILYEDASFTLRTFRDVDGLTTTGFYDIPIVLPGPALEVQGGRHYIIDEIYEAINAKLVSTTTSVNGATISGSYIRKNPDTDTTIFGMDITKAFHTKDYNVVFYDPYSFVSCYSGASRKGSQSVQNATWDTTIGWILGFREKIIYYLNDYADPTGVAVTSLIYYTDVKYEQNFTMIGDTTVSTSLYNYFLIVLDDYTQNHLNDGLVTITTQETMIDVGPYKYICDPYLLSGSALIAVPSDRDYSKMSKRELYTFNQKVLSKKVKEKSYSKGPFVKDIFGIIPIKTSGLSPGSTYVEFGGTLQNQERMYFGPVNIHRMTIRLLNDRGDLVDLNNTNWSFSLVCEQLYKQSL